MARLLLLRAWLDTGSLRGGRGYYSPLTEDGCPMLIPIPETRVEKPWSQLPSSLDPRRWRSRCTGQPLEHYMPLEHPWLLHNDPRLDTGGEGFYTDYYAPKGRLPKSPEKELRPGDVLAFAAGLASYPRGFWERRRRHREILQAFREAVARGDAGLYLVGYLVVQEVIDTSKTGWERAISRHPVLRESPHYHRIGDRPVAVLGKPRMLEKPLRLASPLGGRLCGRPEEPLVEILGARAAARLVKQNCRRSSVVQAGRGVLEKLRALGG